MLPEKNIHLFIDEEDVTSSFEKKSIYEIDTISNGSVSNLVCNFIDKIRMSDKFNLIHVMLNKLKIEGKLFLVFIDFEYFKIQLYRDVITQDEFNAMLSKVEGLTTIQQLNEFIQKLQRFTIGEYSVVNNQTHLIIERKS